MLSERTWGYLALLAEGLGLTIQLMVISIVLATLLALPLALMRFSRFAVMRSLSRQYSFFMRGTPLLVQLYLVYYGLAQFSMMRGSMLWDNFLESPFWCAVLTLTLNGAAYMAEIMYGALHTVDRGDSEAALALGMSRQQVFRRVVVPQAVRQALPVYGNEIILLVKGSALASTITLMELTGVTRSIVAKTYQPIQWLLIAALIYFLLNTAIGQGIRYWEHRLSPYRRG